MILYAIQGASTDRDIFSDVKYLQKDIVRVYILMYNVDMSLYCCIYKQTEESHEHLDSCMNVLRGKTKLLTGPLNDILSYL